MLSDVKQLYGAWEVKYNGFAEGEKHAAIEIAKRMLKTNNFSLEEIAAFSGVSLDDVKILKANQ